jgi:hypothetical protein
VRFIQCGGIIESLERLPRFLPHLSGDVLYIKLNSKVEASQLRTICRGVQKLGLVMNIMFSREHAANSLPLVMGP